MNNELETESLCLEAARSTKSRSGGVTLKLVGLVDCTYGKWWVLPNSEVAKQIFPSLLTISRENGGSYSGKINPEALDLETKPLAHAVQGQVTELKAGVLCKKLYTELWKP